MDYFVDFSYNEAYRWILLIHARLYGFLFIFICITRRYSYECYYMAGDRRYPDRN